MEDVEVKYKVSTLTESWIQKTVTNKKENTSGPWGKFSYGLAYQRQKQGHISWVRYFYCNYAEELSSFSGNVLNFLEVGVSQCPKLISRQFRKLCIYSVCVYTVCMCIVCVCERERERERRTGRGSANVANSEQLVNLGKRCMGIHFNIFFNHYMFKAKSLSQGSTSVFENLCCLFQSSVLLTKVPVRIPRGFYKSLYP